MSSAHRRNGEAKYVLLIVILLLALLGLVYAYSVLVSPPRLAGETVDTEGYAHEFTLYGFGADRLSKPSDVTIGGDGRIYVADTFNHRVVVYDRDGTYIEHFGERGSGRFQLEYPSGIAVAPDGTLFVLSKKLDKVVIYDPSHEPVHEIQVRGPQVATVVGDRLYLATFRGIMVGDLDGELITSFGQRGRESGQVDHPGGIAVAENGTIYVSDSLNYRVQAFDEDGKVLWTVGAPPATGEVMRNKSRRFGLPAGLTLGSDGLIYVVDAFSGVISVFDEDGEELRRFGAWGHEDGAMYYPAGMFGASDNRLAIADKFNDRVQVLTVDSPAESGLSRVMRTPWPWLLPLGLLPLALLIPKTFPADREFLESILHRSAVPNLEGSVRRIEVVDSVRAELEDAPDEPGRRLGELLVKLRWRESLATRLSRKHGLDDDAAALLSRGKRLLGLRTTMLIDSPELQSAASAERIRWLASEDLLEYWNLEPKVTASVDD